MKYHRLQVDIATLVHQYNHIFDMSRDILFNIRSVITTVYRYTFHFELLKKFVTCFVYSIYLFFRMNCTYHLNNVNDAQFRWYIHDYYYVVKKNCMIYLFTTNQRIVPPQQMLSSWKNTIQLEFVLWERKKPRHHEFSPLLVKLPFGFVFVFISRGVDRFQWLRWNEKSLFYVSMILFKQTKYTTKWTFKWKNRTKMFGQIIICLLNAYNQMSVIQWSSLKMPMHDF